MILGPLAAWCIKQSGQFITQLGQRRVLSGLHRWPPVALQQLGRGVKNAFGEEQIMKHEEFKLDESLEQPIPIGTCLHGVAGEHGVGLAAPL